MIKTYEAYNTSFEEADLRNGDRVVVVYKEAIDYLKTGTIVAMVLSGNNKGNCSVLLDFEKKTREFYYTNIKKIYPLVGIPTGEITYIYYKYLVKLMIAGIVFWDQRKQFYYYSIENREKIEEYMI
jgi:hypothetical protein